MIFTRILCTGLLSGVAGVGVACDLPPLVAIPAKADVGAKAAELQTQVAAYFESMKVYTACVQAELATAGGNTAQPIMKAVLVQRNNAAVAEVQAVLKSFNENVVGAAALPAPAAPAAGAPPESPPPGDDESPRARSRNK